RDSSNLKIRADIGITRSASDVLESKIGVCRDYATLFAAMARAVGVPSKVVSGLLYLNDGFYYHAWVECWVGEWVPFDATMPTDFVDATHIKLVEGDATTMFSLAKVIGSLRAEVK
ncbi:MAG: transglutaminase-like domain-containing protein, partial [Armatimonadetes bacterium]|nr:transglutaminase-like domain-containing protein [Armatimonadota bacterium]